MCPSGGIGETKPRRDAETGGVVETYNISGRAGGTEMVIKTHDTWAKHIKDGERETELSGSRCD